MKIWGGRGPKMEEYKIEDSFQSVLEIVYSYISVKLYDNM